MRAVIQRVKQASVSIDGRVTGRIGHGLLIFLAVHQDDKETTVGKTAEKVMNMRIFGDSSGKMNLSVRDTGGRVLVVSQFTLYGNTSRGNRPSFTESAKPEKAILFYGKFVEYIRGQGIDVSTGEFGAMMEVESVNDGPVTIVLDT